MKLHISDIVVAQPEDLLEVTALALSLVAGFHVAAFVMKALGCFNVTVGKQVDYQEEWQARTCSAVKRLMSRPMELCLLFLAAKSPSRQSAVEVQGTTPTMAPTPGFQLSSAQGPDDTPISVHGKTQWATLLEHYGVFGASPGIWSPGEKCDSQESEQDEETVPVPDNAGASMQVGCGTVMCLQSERRWKTLLEHYGVFNGPVGAWSSGGQGFPDDNSQGEKAENVPKADLTWAAEQGRCSTDAQLQEERPWALLLEHHGVFGAPPGSWSRGHRNHCAPRTDADVEE